MSTRSCWPVLAIAAAALAVAAHAPALAQAHNPFSVGISEGGGSATGLSGWLLAKQALFEQMLSGQVRAAKADGSALWMLAGLSFLYGVFHAAGPGHGKAVVASYMFANERALRRGVVISFLAAALQGLVAIALIGVLALVFHATAMRLKGAAQLVESMSYAGIAVLGGWLLWRKGTGFVRAWRAQKALAGRHNGHDHAHGCCGRGPAGEPHTHDDHSHDSHNYYSHDPDHHDHGHSHDAGCDHVHAPDPAMLGDRFSWTSAVMTVVAAGLRPCSGAILVLVFSLAQGLFQAGVLATLAMSMGTAITTSALAILAVAAGGLAVRLTEGGSGKSALIVRGIEAGAGAFILLLGTGLFLGVTTSSA